MFIRTGGDSAIAISNGVEASLGALWGEDPQYFECHYGGLGRRTAHAAKLSVLAARPDGHVAAAWGRYAGTLTSNLTSYLIPQTSDLDHA